MLMDGRRGLWNHRLRGRRMRFMRKAGYKARFEYEMRLRG